MQRSLIGVLVLAVLGVAGYLFWKPGADTNLAVKVPADPRVKGGAFATSQPGQFSLMMFAYLNWPADTTQRGVLDPTKPLGASGAYTVWESFKNTSEIYRPDGSAPAPFQQNTELPSPPDPAVLQKLGAVDSPWVHFLSESRMIDGQQIVDANTSIIRYDVRCNQPHFSYIARNPAGYELFNLQGQEAALADPKYQFAFPIDAIEVKASWRVLGISDDASKYWTAYGAYYNDANQMVYARIGLTAIHIISKVTPDWFWITFEQVDDANATFKYFKQQKGDPVGGNPTINPAAAPINAQLKAMAKGTKWQNYQLVGWQYQYADNSGQPTILANTQIETYFEQTSSCISCHALASIGPAKQVRLTMWNYGPDGVTGMVGPIDFQAIAQKQAPGLAFKPMDHVWSLRQAKSKQP